MLIGCIQAVGPAFYDESEVIDDGMSAGDCGFVLKEYAGTDLFDAIKRAQTGATFSLSGMKNMRNSLEKNERTQKWEKYKKVQW